MYINGIVHKGHIFRFPWMAFIHRFLQWSLYTGFTVYSWIHSFIVNVETLKFWRKLLIQRFLMKSHVLKFYSRHNDLVNRLGISVSNMTTYLFTILAFSSSGYYGIWYHRIVSIDWL